MTDSDFVFLNGEPIDVGNAVENDFVFAGDRLVSDGDVSDFAFIGGRGLGSATVSGGVLTIYDGLSEDDPIITTLNFNINEAEAPSKGTKVPIGFYSSDEAQRYDNIRTGDGTVIEDFDDCNGIDSYFDSAYTGAYGNVSTSRDWNIEGSGDCYLIENNTGLTSRISSSVGAGLQNYPEWGQTILADVYVSSLKDPGITLGGDAATPNLFAYYVKRDSELRIRNSWVENVSKNLNIPSGWQLWKLEF